MSRWPIALTLAALAGYAAPARAALDDLGIPIAPHGFPSFYEANGLQLEPCLPPPAGYAVELSSLCIFDPPQGPPLEVGSEIFWWMAEASAPLLPGVTAGKALLVLALEGAFSEEVPVDGQQMSFGRVRVVADVPVAGTYRVIHPYGEITFENVTVEDGIQYTADLGSINALDPAKGFEGALTSSIGPFLTWPDYLAEPSLRRVNAQGRTEQYVGDPAVPHVVTGGTNGNRFRIEGPGGISTETTLFTVMGKVHDPSIPRTPHVFPPAPIPTLQAVGPVNRGVEGGIADEVLQPDGVTTGVEDHGYPLGIPLWYQDKGADGQGGVRLTYCPGGDPKCISEPIDPADPNSVALRMGGEGFWWSAEAFLDEDTPDASVPGGLEGLLVMAIEAAFGGDESIFDGNQIGFARLRIRVDVPAEGQYTITHPYGVEVFDVVFDPDDDPDDRGKRAINMTRDVMTIDLADPDGAFVGALFGPIGPRFLTWPGYESDPTLAIQQQVLVDGVPQLDADGAPLVKTVRYVGDPAVLHEVVGSDRVDAGGAPQNYFRIQGPNGLDVRTRLFAVSGKVYDPDTSDVEPEPDAPIARQDAAQLDLAGGSSVTIPVLANDTFEAPAQVAILPGGPAEGDVLVNADGSVTYTFTGDPSFSGTDSFVYNVTDATGLTSGNVPVTVTIVPAPVVVDTITLTRARLEQRRLRIDLAGTGNVPTAVLTIYPGASATGDPIGQATVDRRGRWSFRGTAQTPFSRISIVSSEGGALLDQPVQVR